MYHKNGKFGQVRFCRSCINHKHAQTPFAFVGGGWHRCNELYRVHHPNGSAQYTLFITLTAGGRLRMKNRLYELPASSITVIPPHTETEYHTAKGEWWEFYWLCMTDRNAEILEKVIQRQGYVFPTFQITQIQKMAERLFPKQALTDEILFEITASQILSNILHMLLEESYSVSANRQKTLGLVPELIHEIEENYSHDINISVLASENFISTQHMIRLFKAETGYTPYEYLKKYRLHKAIELLSHTDLSITEISKFTGFSNNSNFIYQFRNEYGITPAKYRKHLSAV